MIPPIPSPIPPISRRSLPASTLLAASRLFDAVTQDLRDGLRMLRRAPAFAAAAIATLALAIGANTAIFSVLDALMLRDLPVRAPAQLVELLSALPIPGEPRHNGYPWKVYEHYRDANHVFSDLIGVAPSSVRLTESGHDEEVVLGEFVTGNYFSALGVTPALGRLLGPPDTRDDADAAVPVVVSWTAWTRRFQRDPSILQRRLLLNGQPAAIVGVAPRGFVGLQVGTLPELWAVATTANSPRGLRLMGRLAAGVSIAQAQMEMRTIDRWRVEELSRGSSNPMTRQLRLDLEPASGGFTQLRDVYAKQLTILMALVALLLLVACTSLSTLLLARGAARRKEMALRLALGAGRMRLARQVLTEALLLAAAGGAAGLLIAQAGAGALVRSWRPDPRGWGPWPVEIAVAPDARVLLFTAAIALAAALLFGLASAWHALATAPIVSLRASGAGADRSSSRRLFEHGLVVAQVAISMVLLTAGSLFVQHLARLRSADLLGFQRDAVLLVTLDARRGETASRAQQSQEQEALLARLAAMPGVRAAAISAVTPISGAGWSRLAEVDGLRERPEDRRFLSVNAVTPGYFDTFGTPLLAGRDFRASDRGGAPVAIVNRALARHYFGERSPIGRQIRFMDDGAAYEIVGLVADARYAELHEAPPRQVYLHAFQESRARLSQLALRLSVPPAAVAGDVRRAVETDLRSATAGRVTTLAAQVDAAMLPERLIATLAGGAAGLGALLAAIGLFGLLAHTVTRRTSEMGIRMALGATRGQIARLVLRGAFGLTAVGLAVGAAIGLASRPLAARMVEELSVGVAPQVAAAAVCMLLVALLAAWLPARRAARVDPMVAVRHD